MRSLILLLLIGCWFNGVVYAQEEKELGVSIEIRPRGEFRNGAFTLRNPDTEPAFFVSQRSRLSIDYRLNNLVIGLGLQNIRVWGAVPQIAPDQGNNTMIHEAWAAYYFGKNLSIKAGRQGLVYDDDRILGSLDWHQAGRWHDVLLLRYEPENWELHIGAAYNQDAERIQYNYYTSPRNNYKTLQMLWLGHQLNEKAKFSFLLLNTGYESPLDSNQNFLQTVGGNFYRVNSPLNLTASFYYQRGHNRLGNQVSAVLAAIYGSARMSDSFSLLAGTDYLSGENMDDRGDGETTAFDPLYGTHHKFYGYMDYFYVGNPHQNVGLWDKYAGVRAKLSENFSLQFMAHYFDSGADVVPVNEAEAVDTYLGTELDLTFSWLLGSAVRLNGGYSQMFASESMEVLKGGDHTTFQNWAWLMLTASPQILLLK